MLSTSSPRARGPARRALLLGAAAALSGCASAATPPGPAVVPPALHDDAFVMPDGARLPLRAWLPDGKPHAVVLALHGFNDSRDAWEIPGPDFAAAGIAVYAPDQRGFGAAPGRGLWPGVDGLVGDAAAMTALLRQRHPDARLVLMGESMGGAVLMCLATCATPPPVDGYVLVAPAVWGRARMNVFMRSGLWLAATLVPGMEVSRPPPPVRVLASDNRDALIRLSRDPLTIRSTRFDTLRGLVDLMDAALDAAPRFRAPGLFMYGAKDELVPKAATLVTWQALHQEAPTTAPRLGFYPNGWHLLMRDLGRAAPIGDAIAWIGDRSAPLPSGADMAAGSWLAAQA
ncbi:lysophospholipase [Limobrevibacterium gyesilva]|uniref:Lysophospholipase n=1 Tax=Limobrevibacterium gyesilva TaxID=2991712 RepID=A0AA41YHQ0_9PROT|nr:lysophospholipase [Limobrevibacterium gyesilva]MCW3473601.1 lysophospholipase [Limobrevibacterium gyesilva]